MIPNIKNGNSFRGAGAYYLHDKHAATNKRVAWTRALNLVHDQPDAALDEMWQTASMQDYLRQASGHAVSGRKLENAVKTISLSWHPDEKPGREQMEAAGIQFLEKMGWQDHQALMVAHSDTKHPHIHIVLNRVHPETGLTLNDYRDQRRSQEWALAYEQEHGLVRCQERLKGENDNARQLPKNVIALEAPQAPLPWPWRSKDTFADHERQTLADAQRAERIGFFQEGKGLFREARQDAFRDVRDAYKDVWRDHFAEKSAMEAEAERASGSAFSRGLYFLKQGDVEGAARAAFDKDAVRDAVAAELEEKRLAITDRQKADTRLAQDTACDLLRQERGELYEDIKARQREERAMMRAAHLSGERARWVYDHAVFQQPAANQNERLADERSPPANVEIDRSPVPEHAQTEPSQLMQGMSREAEKVELEVPSGPAVEQDRPARLLPTDAVAGAIGAAAGYVADQLAEFFSPTPPEVREANGRALEAAKERQAAREAEEPNPFAKFAAAAARQAETEREEARSRSYWEHRERSRDR